MIFPERIEVGIISCQAHGTLVFSGSRLVFLVFWSSHLFNQHALMLIICNNWRLCLIKASLRSVHLRMSRQVDVAFTFFNCFRWSCLHVVDCASFVPQVKGLQFYHA